MSDEKDDGGIVMGGISFGMGSTSQTAASGEAEGDKKTARAEGPREMGDALLPLRALVVADLIPRGEYNGGANPPEEAIRLDPGEGLDALFARLGPKLAIKVESVLQQGAEVRVDFAPTSVKSFRPDQLANEIPLLRSILDGRKVLDRLREGTSDVDAARVELSRLWNGSPLVDRVLGGVEVKGPKPTGPAPAPAPADDGGVDRLLDMVDTGTTADAASVSAAPVPPAPAAPSPSTGKGRFDAFLAAVAGVSNKGSVNPSQSIALVEKAFGIQLGAIVQHPEFRRLEEAWRGLDFLATRAPKQSVRLEVVSCGPDDAAERLTQAIDAGAGVEPPVTFAVVDTVIEGDAADWARLRSIADVAEHQTVPTLVNGRGGIFGHADLSEVDRLDNKQALFDAPERAPWRSAVAKSSMLWVSMGINRVLARTAYDRRTSRIREATIEELPGDERAAAVWIEPCWVVASLVLKSFDATGWPHRITGARDGGLAEDLQVREVDTRGSSERIAIPTEVFFSTETQRSLARLGLLGLASQPNNDAVYLLHAPTAYVPPPKRSYEGASSGPEEDRFPQAPLVDQLFVARLVQFLRALGSRIAPTEAPEDIKAFLEAALWELFDVAKPGTVELSVEVKSEGLGPVAMVTVRPRRFLGVGMEEFSLGVPLG